ncbi:unnamed protein product [Mytilus edulis]|uniref:Death domain-containing protein n=1 Tax=Mytilus edulis TaxID=6550 RepID=A0A8S3QQY9_MYTED|nr:unnamed protein product [Mytilus edulis]
MVTERNTTSFMDKECTPERAICLAFLFKGTIIPPALPNRLISACLSMWTVKQYEGRQLLFSGFIGLSFDKSHDIVVCVEGNKILLYIIHRTSSGLIVSDIATGVKECLVVTMERISDFYQSTIHAKRSQQSPFHIEYTCSSLKCFISEEEAKQTNGWICDKHNQIQKAGHWRVWNQDQNDIFIFCRQNEQCEEDCQGLNDDALSKTPSDIVLLRFSNHCKLNQMHELVTHLGMLRKWENIEYNHHIPADYLDFIPTDEILDKLAPLIGQVFFQLGTEIGLSIPTLENIQSNNPSDLAEQNRVVLFKWREDQLIKPTIRVLMQALVNIGRGARCLEEVLKNIDLNTLIVSQQSRGKGAIPKKPKISSELESQNQGKSQNVDEPTDRFTTIDK